jgi:hypothetical protein
MRKRAKTILTPVRKIPSYAVIIRSIWCRGAEQEEALEELDRRGLWLNVDQKVQAGLANYWPARKLVNLG